MKSVVVDLASGNVLNIIVADPAADDAPEGTRLVRIGLSPVDIGWTYEGGVFSQTLSAEDMANYLAAEDAAVLNAEG